MGRCRVVIPAEIRLPLSDGDWVDVKKELNAGEYRKLVYDQAKETPEGDRLVLDHTKIGMARLLAYVLGWSLSGVNQDPIPYRLEQPEEVRRATIDALDRDTYRELIEAVTAHETREDTAREAKKNAPATVPGS